MKTPILFFALIGLVSISTVITASACPCNPCRCSPCTCGGGGGGKSFKGEKGERNESHHSGKRGEHHEGHTSVGVGVNVDLGGIGHRKREADPFAVANDEPVAHTQEKAKFSKPKEEISTTSLFSDVRLTGSDAKEEKPAKAASNP